jgi:hypothetical protein
LSEQTLALFNSVSVWFLVIFGWGDDTSKRCNKFQKDNLWVKTAFSFQLSFFFLRGLLKRAILFPGHRAV